MKGTASYYSIVMVQVVPTRKAGGAYKTPKEAMDAIKKQILTRGSDVKFLNEGSMELPQNPQKYHGTYLVVTYTIKTKQLKKMQVILQSDKGLRLYSWGFTSTIDQFPNDLSIAKAMYESWKIE